MSLTCKEVDQKIRGIAIDQLQTDVRRHEDMFLLALDWGEPELGVEAIAEWAWGLLERQRAAMIEAVERALNDTDNDNEEQT